MNTYELNKRLEETGKPFKIYADIFEDAALEQFVEVMEHPAVDQGAVMPDAHAGYVLNIGGVVAVRGMVFPSFVGVDIGCGMIGIPTTFEEGLVRENAKAIFEAIYANVPTGHNHNAKETKWDGAGIAHTKVIDDLLNEGALKQLGTLGGGNHFIEIGKDETNQVWIIIHSGSRNIGKRTADHYVTVACGGDKPKWGLDGFDVNSAEGRDYIKDLNFCLEFALANRLEMVKRIESAIGGIVKGQADYTRLINRNHNHAELKDGLWIHRKGATHAEAGMMGVIPGSMRDGSFIVSGKGNPESLCSSSHGAGRIMSRSQAKKTLDLEKFREEMAAKGICAKVDESTLDESGDAYKNIWEVMEQQHDLVEIKHYVSPIINIKS